MQKQEKIAKIKNFIGKTVDCEIIFNALCEDGNWKYDTEESDILLCFMKTWEKEQIIAKIIFEDGVCAPPYGEEGVINKIIVGKFDNDDYVSIPDISNDLENDDPAYFIAKYGDPNYELELIDIQMEDLPEAVLNDLFEDIFEPLSDSILE